MPSIDMHMMSILIFHHFVCHLASHTDSENVDMPYAASHPRSVTATGDILDQCRRNVAYVAKAIRMTTSSEKLQSKDQRERARPNDLTLWQAQAIAEQFAKKTCDLAG